MPSIFRKNFNLCFSKIKCLPTSNSPPLTVEDDEQEHEPPRKTMTIYDNPTLVFSSSSCSAIDFSAILASQRLFVASPGHSNSILESSSSGDRLVVGGGVAVNKYSPDPYTDFRESMQEMMEAREVQKKNHPPYYYNEGEDLLEYLQQLLVCYLNLNPKHTHKFIIEAFADILLSLMSS